MNALHKLTDLFSLILSIHYSILQKQELCYSEDFFTIICVTRKLESQSLRISHTGTI